MLDGDLFDKLVGTTLIDLFNLLQVLTQEAIARGVRRNDRPFGGIQVRGILLMACYVYLILAARPFWRFLPAATRVKDI